MIEDQVEFFNVEEVEKYNGGLLLSKFPKAAKSDLSARGSWMADSAHGCEVRFKSTAKAFWITLGAAAEDVDVYVMRGDYFIDRYTIASAGKITLQFEQNLFDGIDESMLNEARFSREVWRFYLHSVGAVIYYGIRGMNGKIMPPDINDEPKHKILAYGSSITHWCWATDSRNSYIQQLALRLGMDVYNKALAGACCLEKSITQYLASVQDWSFAFMELGVNVFENMTAAEFEEKTYSLLDAVGSRHTDRKIFLTGMYDSKYTLKHYDDVKFTQYREILMNASAGLNNVNIVYLDGRHIMTSTEFLSRDFLHPSDYGQLMMGENLAKLISEHIK